MNCIYRMLIGLFVVQSAIFGTIESAGARDVASQSATDSAQYKPFQIKLTASKAKYQIGEPVMLKVEIVNQSPEPIKIFNLTPWDAVSLTIIRDGKVIPTIRPPAPFEWRFPYGMGVQPGTSFTLHWKSDFNPITWWGYDALPQGHYAVFATPKRIEGRTPSRGHFLFDHDGQSNAVQIDVGQ